MHLSTFLIVVLFSLKYPLESKNQLNLAINSNGNNSKRARTGPRWGALIPFLAAFYQNHALLRVDQFPDDGRSNSFLRQSFHHRFGFMRTAGRNHRAFADRGIRVDAEILADFRNAVLDHDFLFLDFDAESGGLGDFI